MTSRTSSNKKRVKKSPNRYAFTSAFSIGPVAFNICVLASLFLIGAFNPRTLQRFKLNSPGLLYYFNPLHSPFALYFLIIFQAMVTAAMIFGFTANKRTATAYFGLPVKRSALFFSRFSAGFLMMTLPQAVIFGLLLLGNLTVFGNTPVVWQGFFAMFGASFTLMFVCYSVTAALSMYAGTAAEALVFSIVLLFILPSLPLTVPPLFSMFLHGNSWGEIYNMSPVSVNAVTNAVFKFWYPLGIVNYFGYYAAPTQLTAPPRIAAILAWLIIAMGITAFAYRAFTRYKAENSGTLGVNGKLNNLITFLITSFSFFAALGFADADITNYSILTALLISLVISLTAFLLCRFLLTLSIRKIFEPKGFVPFLANAGLAALLILICVTGGFGYKNYQPKPEEVVTASITYIGSPEFWPGQGETFGNFYFITKDDADIFVRDYHSANYAPSDKEKIMGLHKRLIDAEGERIKLQTHVRYYLEDGREVNRFYKTVPADFVKEYLTRQEESETAARKKKEATVLPKQFYAENPNAGNFIITDSLFGNITEVPPGDIQGLLDAMQKDINSLSPEERNEPNAAARAVICLPRHDYNDEKILVEPEMNFFNYMVSLTRDTQGAPALSESAGLFNDTQVSFVTGPSTDALRYYLTEGWGNTLAFLRERELCGWLDAQPGQPDVSGVTAMHAAKLDLFPDYQTQSLYFRSYALINSNTPVSALADADGAVVIMTEGNGARDLPADVSSVPADKYAELLKAARTHYFTGEGGYLLYADLKIEVPEEFGTEFDTESTRRVTLFIPEKDAPVWMKQ